MHWTRVTGVHKHNVAAAPPLQASPTPAHLIHALVRPWLHSVKHSVEFVDRVGIGTLQLHEDRCGVKPLPTRSTMLFCAHHATIPYTVHLLHILVKTICPVHVNSLVKKEPVFLFRALPCNPVWSVHMHSECAVTKTRRPVHVPYRQPACAPRRSWPDATRPARGT